MKKSTGPVEVEIRPAAVPALGAFFSRSAPRGEKSVLQRGSRGQNSQRESRFFEAVEMASGDLEKLPKNPI
jgi:hypothetical protein